MGDSLKFEITFKKGDTITKDPRVKAEEFVSVVKESINISAMEKKSPYKYFDMQFLRSSLLEENALKMATAKYSNSDVANVMTNVSQESGKKASKMGVFVNYTPKLLGSDLEKDPDLVTLSKYWVSNMSRHKYASIRQKVKEPIIKDFCDTSDSKKVIQLNELNLYADYLATPNADTNVTTSMNIDGQEFINSRFIPGSFLDVMFQDDAIDDIYLPRDLLENDYKSLKDYLTVSSLAKYNTGKIGATGVVGAGLGAGLGAGGAALAGAALGPVALGAAAVGALAGGLALGKRVTVPIVIRKRINITNEPENIDSVDIPLEEYLTNITNIFIQYVNMLEGENLGEAPILAGAAQGLLNALVAALVGDPDEEVAEEKSPAQEEYIFYSLLNYEGNQLDKKDINLDAKKVILRKVLLIIDTKLSMFDTDVKNRLMSIYNYVIEHALDPVNITPQAIITAANTAFKRVNDHIARQTAALPTTSLVIPGQPGQPPTYFLIDGNNPDENELKRRIVLFSWHLRTILFETSTNGYVTSGGINKKFKQPPPFTQELDFFIYSEFDPYDVQWKDSTYSNTQLISSLWTIVASLPTGIRNVWRTYVSGTASESVEEQNIKNYIDENKSTPFKYLIFRAKKIAVRPVPLSKKDILHVDSLDFIEPTSSTSFFQRYPTLYERILGSTTLSGTGNRILTSITRVGMLIKNFWTKDMDYNVNPAWLSLFHLLSARNFSCPAYFETLLQSDIVEGREGLDIDGASDVLETAARLGITNIGRYAGAGIGLPVTAGIGAPFALAWLAPAIASGLIIPVGVGIAAATAVATAIPESWYISENVYKKLGRGNNTIAGLLTVFFNHVKENKSTFGITGTIADLSFIVTKNKMEIITKKLMNISTSEINKNDLVNFEMLPSLLPSAMKIFPTTYNKPLGDLLVQYDQNRAKFLDDRPWEKRKDKKPT